MSEPNEDLDQRLKVLAEDTVDRLNTDAPDPAGPVMLTSYVLIVEGNGWREDGTPVSRSVTVSHGSVSQVKGLLVDALDDIRGQGIRAALEE